MTGALVLVALTTNVRPCGPQFSRGVPGEPGSVWWDATRGGHYAVTAVGERRGVFLVWPSGAERVQTDDGGLYDIATGAAVSW